MAANRADRRRFLKRGLALAGVAVGAQSVSGQIPGSAEHPGHGQDLLSPGLSGPAGHSKNIPDLMAYGERSRFVNTARTPFGMIPNMDMHRNPNGFSAFSPVQEMIGTITPAPLHYISSHGHAPPDLDPREHRLGILGMVDRPLVFTLNELMRLPHVSRVHYPECVHNAPDATRNKFDEAHGMISCSQWTGVPLSLLLKEVGVKGGGSWILAEGAEPAKHAMSVPMGKAMDDVLVAWGQNGEPVRPHQGYPLRLVVPGFEGKYSVKWLKRISVVDRPFLTYWQQSVSYPALEQGPKSVITFPSAGQRLPDRGFYGITGLVWSGGGAVREVEVSTDGGRTWKDAQLEQPVLRMALARFHFPWTWDGTEVVLQSRCTDELGRVQPTAADHSTFWGSSVPPHGNSIQPWRVTREGDVVNAHEGTGRPVATPWPGRFL